jgi:hypothetical protein
VANYIFRYLDDNGALTTIVHAECVDDAEALRAAIEQVDAFAALEISRGKRIVWSGIHADAIAAARGNFSG